MESHIMFLRVDNSTDEMVLIIHNLSDQNQTGFIINSISSDIPSGVFNLINVENSYIIGTLTINATGGFNLNLTNLTLGPYSSMVLSLQ